MSGRYWDKFAVQRITRRRALQSAGIVGAAAGAIALVGCGGGDDDGDKTPGATKEPGTTAEAGRPTRGGTHQIRTAVNFDTFDPHISIAGGVAYFPRLYNAIFNYSALKSDFVFKDLAESLEQPDEKTFIFKIRPGVKVAPNSLGVPERDMDANDAVASFERIKTLPQSNAFGFIGKYVESITASADGQTLTIKTPTPYAYFFNRIGSPINLIPPKELLDAANTEKLKTQAAGGGPFTLKSYTEGQGATFARNPNYYRKDENNNNEQLPYIDGIEVRVAADRAAQRTAFQSKQSYQYTAENVTEAEQLQSSGKYTVIKDPVNTFIALTMNPTKKPWDDDRIRKAALHAFDRQVFIDKVYKGEAKANGLMHWPQGDLAFSDDELEKYQKYDPAMSKALIREATGNDTVDVTIMWPADSIIEEHNLHLPIFLEQMRQAGFNVKADAQPFGQWLENYTNLNYDASLALNQVYEYGEFNMDFQHSEGPARNNIYTIGVGKLYPEIDAAIDKTKQITDREQFTKAIRDLQVLIYEKGPTFLPLVSPYSFTLYHDFVKNIPQGLGASGLFVNTWWLDTSKI